MPTRRLFSASLLAAVASGPAAASGLPTLTAPRAAHMTVRLDDGSVLLIGGCVEKSCVRGPASATVDRFDPRTRTIRRAGSLVWQRLEAAAVALPGRRALVAGGWGGSESGLSADVEIFEADSGKSRRVAQLSEPQVCIANRLADGRIVIIGGRTAEIFDPASGRIRRLAATPEGHGVPTATLLTDGRILVIGGGAPPSAAAHLFDPASGRFEATGPLSTPRYKHAALRLRDGRVLAIGGSDARDRRGKLRALEVWDPRTGRFTTVGETGEARFKIAEASVRLADGRVLVTGGASQPELIDPNGWTVRLLDYRFEGPLNFSSAVLLASGDVLVAGGYWEGSINPTDKLWVIPRAALA